MAVGRGSAYCGTGWPRGREWHPSSSRASPREQRARPTANAASQPDRAERSSIAVAARMITSPPEQSRATLQGCIRTNQHTAAKQADRDAQTVIDYVTNCMTSTCPPGPDRSLTTRTAQHVALTLPRRLANARSPFVHTQRRRVRCRCVRAPGPD